MVDIQGLTSEMMRFQKLVGANASKQLPIQMDSLSQQSPLPNLKTLSLDSKSLKIYNVQEECLHPNFVVHGHGSGIFPDDTDMQNTNFVYWINESFNNQSATLYTGILVNIYNNTIPFGLYLSRYSNFKPIEEYMEEERAAIRQTPSAYVVQFSRYTSLSYDTFLCTAVLLGHGKNVWMTLDTGDSYFQKLSDQTHINVLGYADDCTLANRQEEINIILKQIKNLFLDRNEARVCENTLKHFVHKYMRDSDQILFKHQQSTMGVAVKLLDFLSLKLNQTSDCLSLDTDISRAFAAFLAISLNTITTPEIKSYTMMIPLIATKPEVDDDSHDSEFTSACHRALKLHEYLLSARRV